MVSSLDTSERLLREYLPLEQGLRQHPADDTTYYVFAPRVSSIRTRIKTCSFDGIISQT